MNVHVKPEKYLSEAKSLKIARAIFAGASHKEVAEEHGVSVRQVQVAVERIRRMIAASASVIPQIGRGGNIVQFDEYAKKRKPVVWEPASKAAREIGLKAVRTQRCPVHAVREHPPQIAAQHSQKAGQSIEGKAQQEDQEGAD